MNSPLESLARLRDARTKRISSYSRTGGNGDRIGIEPGETVTIARIDGPGCIRHIWVTVNHGDPMYLRNVILRAYWDGHDKPSIECPIGDFFGQGWGEHYVYASLPLAASEKAGRAMNCYFPMPFADGARLTIENDSEHPCRSFYYYVDYQEFDRPQGDMGPLAHMGRFHAFWNRSFKESPQKVENEWSILMPFADLLTDEFNHLIIDAEGRGHYVGVNYYVDCPTPVWYGEGDDMFFIDGEPWPPSLHGTGTEDYFNSAWCPKEKFCHPYFGYPRVNGDIGHLGRTHCYRFHIEDPVIFQKSLRGSIERGHADALTTDVVTVAYWYQTLPHKPFPALPARQGRMNKPPITVRDIHRWREAWRQLLGGGALWGNEPLPPAFVERLKKKAEKAKARMAPEKRRKVAQAEAKKYEAMLKGKAK